MTRTALRRRPPPSQDGLLRRDDRELLALVTGEPPGSTARSAACEILVQRYEGQPSWPTCWGRTTPGWS
jgi:hypothetical protein